MPQAYTLKEFVPWLPCSFRFASSPPVLPLTLIPKPYNVAGPWAFARNLSTVQGIRCLAAFTRAYGYQSIHARTRVRVPRAYGSQSIHAKTIMTFVFLEHLVPEHPCQNQNNSNTKMRKTPYFHAAAILYGKQKFASSFKTANRAQLWTAGTTAASRMRVFFDEHKVIISGHPQQE